MISKSGQISFPSLFGALLRDGLENDRVLKWYVLANDTDITANFQLIYEDGLSIPDGASRAPDDESYLDHECTAANEPYARCLGINWANKRSPQRQACIDNNQTVNASIGCYDQSGNHHNQCLNIAYTSNAFIPQCNYTNPNVDAEHCGTYIEIHQLQGSPYQLETEKIAEVQIPTLNVSGYYTASIPLTWMGNPNTTLCSYTESFIRIGSIVYIEPTAPVCCCPKPFNGALRVGSFQCPYGATGNGPFAAYYKTLADVLLVDPIMLQYPFCPSGLEDDDK
jgi:hypothetical protein